MKILIESVRGRYDDALGRVLFLAHVGAGQALYAAERMNTIGIGFVKEHPRRSGCDLPIQSGADAIWQHIKKNRFGAKKKRCREALHLLLAISREELRSREPKKPRCHIEVTVATSLCGEPAKAIWRCRLDAGHDGLCLAPVGAEGGALCVERTTGP